MKKNIDTLFIIISVVIVVLLCDLCMPYIYSHAKTDHYRTSLLLKKLQDPDFKPEVIVFGSSASMCGIDCYQMTEETGMDSYNFSSTGQPQEESSLYFSLLPKSVKAVVQVVELPVREKQQNSMGEKKYTLSKTITSSFVLGGYEISRETKDINRFVDLSDFDKSKLLVGFDARASVVIPTVTTWLIPRDKAATEDFKYPNAYLGSRHNMYERTVKQALAYSVIGKEIEIDRNSLTTLNDYARYFRQRGIAYYVVLMPVNPDAQRYTREQSEWIAQQIKEGVPDGAVVDYLNLFNDANMFYDGEHINRNGAKILTGLLDKKLMENIK